MKKDTTNLGHLSDADREHCECEDIQCSCAGNCTEKPVWTMHETDNEETTVEMCNDCAMNAWEAGTHQSDTSKDGYPDENDLL